MGPLDRDVKAGRDNNCAGTTVGPAPGPHILACEKMARKSLCEASGANRLLDR